MTKKKSENKISSGGFNIGLYIRYVASSVM